MAKFLDKKERVFDIQLTTYGKYLLSIGKLQPVYYAFFDDNILYDKRYISSSSRPLEPQNDIHTRIKNDTQYLESLVNFRDLEDLEDQIELIGESQYVDATPLQQRSRGDMFRYEKPIGDSYFAANAENYAPAWKIVTLQNKITSSAARDEITNSKIPQINVTLEYEKKIVRPTDNLLVNSIQEMRNQSPTFSDGYVVELVSDHGLFYLEEMNTALLVENFDIEVFEEIQEAPADDPGGEKKRYERRFFTKDIPNVENGYMVASQPQTAPVNRVRTTASVEYYFDIVVDQDINSDLACKGAELFNKQNYYIDLDFDCQTETSEGIYFDIYGRATEPEICQ